MRHYRAMHYGALVQSAVLRSHVVRLSLCLSVFDVAGSGPHRLESLETDCTDKLIVFSSPPLFDAPAQGDPIEFLDET